MSEIPNADTNREINEAEAAYFVESIQHLEPLLEPLFPPEVSERLSDMLPDGGTHTTEVKGASFMLADKLVEVERRYMSFDIPEEGASESTTWYVHIWGNSSDIEEAVSQYDYEDSFSVVAEGRRVGYPTYERRYISVDPASGASRQVSSSPTLSRDLLDELRDESDETRRIQILTEALDKQEAQKRELEELTGIDDSSLFTPERMYEAIELLQKIGPANQRPSPRL
jgi:hypothetical protein